jgi:PAS domain S-box-containing protein
MNDENGRAVKAMVVTQDVTIAKQTELEIMLNQERLQKAQEIGRIGSFEYHLESHSIWISEEGYLLAGITNQNIAFNLDTLHKLLPETDQIMKKCQQLTAENPRLQMETLFTPLDDSSHKIINLIAMFDFDAGGKLIRVTGLLQDITEHKKMEAHLMEAEGKNALLAEIVDKASQPLGIVFFDGRLGLMNHAFCELTGYSEEELKQLSWLEDLTLPGYRALEKAELDVCLKTGSPVRYEKEFIRKSGMPVPVEMNVHLIRETDGLPKFYCAFISDISERLLAQKALQESEEKMRAMFQSMTYAATIQKVIRNDAGKAVNYIITETNSAFTKHTGLLAENVVGKLITEVFSAEEPPFGDIYFKVADSKQPISFETYFEPLNRYFQISSFALDNDLFANVFEDITDRKVAEIKLKESEEKLQLAISAGQLGIWFWDILQDKLEMSDTCATIFGFAKGITITYQEWIDTIHPADQQGRLQAVNQAISSKSDYCREYRILWEDGSVHWISGQGRARYNEAGVPVQMIGVVQDITSRKQIEGEIRELNFSLEQRVKERTGQLELMVRELEAFSYSVSHDLRTPLRGIDGWSLALLEDYEHLLDDQAKEYLASVRLETQRMGHLIDALLQLSRVTRTEIRLQKIDVSELATQVCARVQQQYANRDIQFSIEADLSVEADGNLLEIVLTNLVDNACKFTGTRKTAIITIGKMILGGEDVFFIRDNGVGFNMAHTKKLFGAFQRMHKASDFPGTGVGMATAHRIIQRHGGRIWAEAYVDEGATFYFTIGEKYANKNNLID